MKKQLLVKNPEPSIDVSSTPDKPDFDFLFGRAALDASFDEAIADLSRIDKENW